MRNDKYIPKTEAAKRRGVSRQTILAQTKRGLIPVDERGRIPRAAFEQLQARLCALSEETSS